MNFVIEPNLSNIILILLAIMLINLLLYENNIGLNYIIPATVFLMFVAIIEPAPTDLLFISILTFFIKVKAFSKDEYLKMRHVIWILLLYLLVAGLSMFNIENKHAGVRYYGISGYLIIFCLIIYLYTDKDNYITILRAFVASCIMASTIGIIGYLGFFPEYLRMDEWRTKSLFKDPNVFGAYLIPGILLLVGDLKTKVLFPFKEKEEKNRSFLKYLNIQVLFNLFLTAILITGIIIAFSRGAWVSLAVGIFALFILNIKKINLEKFVIP